MQVHVLDIFLRVEFQKDWKKNVGAVWGRNFPSPIEKAHRLYNIYHIIIYIRIGNQLTKRNMDDNETKS